MSAATPEVFKIALQHHQAGRLPEAEALYHQLLAAQANHPGALHLLGVIALQSGQPEKAAKMIRQALAIDPANAGAHSNLGEACRALGLREEALACHRRAIELQGDFAAAHYNLAVALAEFGQPDAAIAEYREALRLKPDYLEACNNLGNALNKQGLFREAVDVYERALQLKPDVAQVWFNLGIAFAAVGRFEDAVSAYQRAAQLQPEHAESSIQLGYALQRLGRAEEALAAYQRAVALQPDNVEPRNNMGNALRSLGRLDEAVAAYQRALQIDSAYALAHNNLGTALRDQGRLDEALAAYRRALELQPDDARVRSNVIYSLHFHPDRIEPVLAEEQANWHRQFAEPLQQPVLSQVNDRDPERRLRVGYVSSDFRDHVVGRNLVPLFRCHDHARFEIVCYSGVARPDGVTERLRRHADQWRSTMGLSDEALSGMIRQDAVDILVDLTQHMMGNRLLVFARRPAPVQVSFAGYPESAGVDAIRYRISDRWLESGMEIPSGRERSPSVPYQGRAERVFLLDSFWCYDPCGMDAEVNSPPVEANGAVTFGSLNNFCKVNDGVLKVWSRVLGAVANSRLVLLSPFGSHRQRVWELLEREGVGSSRVEFVELRPRREYLKLYHRLDIVLDPFPYGGHTTSLDALWMGVPVVSLAGERAVSRAGLGQMSNLGLRELVALSEDEYVAIAARLADDLPRLAELRRSLRSRMESSPLMDALNFACKIEAAYRTMWRHWCTGVHR